MNRALILALAAAPILAASAGVFAAQLGPHDMAGLEREFTPGRMDSSCVGAEAVAVQDARAIADSALAWRNDRWSMDVFAAESPDCAHLSDSVVECSVRAPARVIHARGGADERAYDIQTIGEHRVRASHRGVSCRRMS